MNMGLYYRGGQGAVIVYDVTSRESFVKAQESLAEVRATLGVGRGGGGQRQQGEEPWKRNGMVVALAGNKRDLVRGTTAGGIRGEDLALPPSSPNVPKREVEEEEGREYAEREVTSRFPKIFLHFSSFI